MHEYIIKWNGIGVEFTKAGANSIYLCKKIRNDRLMETIVRCRDCKYYDHEDLFDDEMWWCIRGASDENVFEVEPDGFCKWGERRG